MSPAVTEHPGTVGAAPHPRIRARQAAVRRDEGRRRLRRLLWASGAVAVLAGSWGASRTPLLDVDHVRVTGAARSGAEAVAEASGIHRGDRMAGAQLDRAAREVATLPWVERAEVDRRWPGTVRIRVVERTAVAVAPAEVQGWLLLDRTGRQLAYVPGPPPELVRLDVAPVPAAPGQDVGRRLDDVLAAAATVPGALLPRVVVLRLGDSGLQAVVRLEERPAGAPPSPEAVVLLGAPSQLRRAWLALATVLDEANLRGVIRIDLRVPDAPVLTRG